MLALTNITPESTIPLDLPGFHALTFASLLTCHFLRHFPSHHLRSEVLPSLWHSYIGIPINFHEESGIVTF